jgi:hypothetical protein
MGILSDISKYPKLAWEAAKTGFVQGTLSALPGVTPTAEIVYASTEAPQELIEAYKEDFIDNVNEGDPELISDMEKDLRAIIAKNPTYAKKFASLYPDLNPNNWMFNSSIHPSAQIMKEWITQWSTDWISGFAAAEEMVKDVLIPDISNPFKGNGDDGKECAWWDIPCKLKNFFNQLEHVLAGLGIIAVVVIIIILIFLIKAPPAPRT